MLMMTPHTYRPRMTSVRRSVTLLMAACALLLSACMSPTEPDTPRIRIAEPSRYFLRTFNISNIDYIETAYDMREVSTGGFIIVGSAWMQHNLSLDIFLLRTDAEGNQLWLNTFGGIKDEHGYSVSETADGGFVIGGSTYSFTNGQSDAWIVKTDENGDMQWSSHFGGTEQDEAYEVHERSAGGYIIVGYSDDPITGGRHLFLRRTDPLGTLDWHHQPAGSGEDYGAAVVETDDGGFVAVGKTKSLENGLSQIWLYKVNTAGDTLWNRRVDGSIAMEAVDLVQAADGSFAIVGSSAQSQSREMLFVKADASGDLQSVQTLQLDAIAQCIRPRLDGGFVVCGYTDPFGGDNSDMVLVRLDENGANPQKTIIGGMHMDRAHAVTPTSDGGYILAGTTKSYGSGTPDVILVKTDANGSYEQ